MHVDVVSLIFSGLKENKFHAPTGGFKNKIFVVVDLEILSHKRKNQEDHRRRYQPGTTHVLNVSNMSVKQR